MSTNNSIIYIGLDIGKDSLQVNLQNQNFPIPNTRPGHRKLIVQLKALGQPLLVVCEATGGYEQAIVAALHQAGIPVAIVEPARVRHFANPLPDAVCLPGSAGQRLVSSAAAVTVAR